MNLGDILTRDQVRDLPVGSVVVHDEDGDDAGWFNTVTRTEAGFAWYSIPGGCMEHDEMYVDDWRLVHLPTPRWPDPRVGDEIRSREQAERLPVGSVVYDEQVRRAYDAALAGPGGRAAVKVALGSWMFYAGDDEAEFEGDDLFDEQSHRLIRIPDADTVTNRSAA